jgi:capsular polysaccharide biosynthesis protein
MDSETPAGPPSVRLLQDRTETIGEFRTGLGVTGYNFERQHTVDIDPPVALQPEALEVDRQYGAGPTYVLHLPDGFVDPETGYVFTADRSFVRETAVVQKYVQHAEQLFADYDFESPLRLGGAPIGVLSNQRAANYSHWWLDLLAKAMLFERRPASVGGEGRPSEWVINRPADPQQAAALELLNIKPTLIETPGTLVRGPLLLSNGLTFSGAQAISGLVREFSTYVLDKAAPLTAPPPRRGRRLYITRRSARMRRLLNEDELLAELTPRGFEVLALEELPLLAQIEAFNHADVVVAPHGAGLTNLLFCRPGALAVELFPDLGVHSSAFRRIATHLGLPYALFAGPSAPDRATRKNLRNADFRLNAVRFAAFLDRTCRAHARRG